MILDFNIKNMDTKVSVTQHYIANYGFNYFNDGNMKINFCNK